MAYLIMVCLLCLGLSTNQANGELLQDYHILSQIWCQRTEENNVTTACPASMDQSLAFHAPSCNITSVHLLRDPFNVRPPRLLTVYSFDGTSIYWSVESFHFDEHFVHIYPVNTTFILRLPQSKEKVVSTVLDVHSRTLFMISQSNGAIDKFVTRFLFNDLDGRSSFSLLGDRHVLHNNNDARSSWTEDPYRQTVYYTQHVDAVKYLYSIPMPLFLSSLINGVSGYRIGPIENAPYLFFSVMDNFLFKMTLGKGNSIARIENGGISTNETMCNGQINAKPAFFFGRILLVEKAEYRQLADNEERILLTDCHFRIVPKKNTDENCGSVLWLSIVVGLLCMVVVVLFVYACFLRSRLESFPVESNSQYYPSRPRTENSFDVSVDQWEH